MSLTVAEMAARLGGVVEGNGSRPLTGVAALSEAGPSELSFLTNVKYAAQMAGTRAAAVLVGPQWKGESPAALIRVPDPDRAFAQAAVVFAPPGMRFCNCSAGAESMPPATGHMAITPTPNSPARVMAGA